QLPDGNGTVTFKLTPEGGTAIAAALATGTLQQSAARPLPGLENGDYHGELAAMFFALGVNWRDYAAPPIAAVDFGQLPVEGNATRIAQTILKLHGEPLVSRGETVSYTCSSNASYVGEPGNLSSMVVLRGTIRAMQTTTTTTTAQVLTLTVNDLAAKIPASIDDAIGLLKDFPDLVGALQGLKSVPAADNADKPAAPAKQETVPQVSLAEPLAPQQLPATAAAPEPAEVASSRIEAVVPKPTINWLPILVTLGILCVLILLVSLLPRFTLGRRRDTVTPPAQSTLVEKAPAPAAEEAAPQVSSTPEKPDARQERPLDQHLPDQHLPDQRQDVPIAVLETLRNETETFQARLHDALEAATSDAQDSKQLKEKLTRVQRQLVRVTDAKAKLEEVAQDDRAKLHKAQAEARSYKELVIDLKTRLA
ncbi:MAG: hypothetical protein ACR2OM_10440, partial [Aestuariivirgaceae bacterium]